MPSTSTSTSTTTTVDQSLRTWACQMCDCSGDECDGTVCHGFDAD